MQERSENLSPEAAKALVRDWWEALGRYDVAAITALMADDIEWEIKFVGSYLPDGGIARGKQNSIRNNIEMFGAIYDVDRLDLKITNMISDGASVVIEFVLDGYTTAGVRYDNVEYVSVIELRDGKVRKVREYMDALKAKEAHSF